MLRPPALCALALAAAAPLSACHSRAEIGVREAWVRLPAVPGRPAAAYFTLAGGTAEARLTGVASSKAARAEMHETMDMRGMSTMTPIARVTISAGGDTRFAPGGRHVMLFGLDPALTPGDTVPLTLAIAGRQPLSVDAVAVAAGAPPPFAK